VKKSSVFSILALVMVLMPCMGSGGETERLYVIERDTLQTRNFTPIINHETMLFNLGDRPLSLELNSPIPAGKFVKGKYYPAFLEESLLPDPLFSPIEVTTKKTSYLAKPEIKTAGDKTSFVWKKVAIPPGEAMIAQYDNYLGEPSLYWSKDGLEVFGLTIRTNYSAQRKAGDGVLSFDYELANATGSELSDLMLDVFIPLRLINETKETTLLELKEIAFSPNAEIAQVTKADGFGRATSGVSIILWSRSLAQNGKLHFFLRLMGGRTTETGEIWPIITIRGRSLQQPLWPPTRIKMEEKVNEGRFSYVSYNLVIQDSRVLRISPQAITMVPAK